MGNSFRLSIILRLFINIHEYINYKRNSDRGNGRHNVSLPLILKRIKVSKMLQSSCISLLLVPIL